MKFKCKQSGNVFEFYTDHDIKTMRSHPEYQELIEEQPSKALEIENKPANRAKKILNQG